MSQYVSAPTKTFTSGGAIAKYARVKLASGVVTQADADDVHIGVAAEPAFESGKPVTVCLRTAQGTRKMLSGGTIAAGAAVFGADDGEVSASGSVYAGRALEAGSDGDVLEVLDDAASVGIGQYSPLQHFTAAHTLTKEESGKLCTNLGATGAVAITLPQDAVAGTYFDFCVMVAQELRIEPSSAGGIYIGGSKQTDDMYVTADAINESLRMTSLGDGDWVAQWVVGTWSVEGA